MWFVAFHCFLSARKFVAAIWSKTFRKKLVTRSKNTMERRYIIEIITLLVDTLHSICLTDSNWSCPGAWLRKILLKTKSRRLSKDLWRLAISDADKPCRFYNHTALTLELFSRRAKKLELNNTIKYNGFLKMNELAQKYFRVFFQVCYSVTLFTAVKGSDSFIVVWIPTHF